MPDININLKIADQNTQRVASAFNALAGRTITILGEKGNYSQTFPEKTNETNKQFIVKMMKLSLKMMVEFYELSVDNERYKTDIDGINLPSANVPDDIVEDI